MGASPTVALAVDVPMPRREAPALSTTAENLFLPAGVRPSATFWRLVIGFVQSTLSGPGPSRFLVGVGLCQLCSHDHSAFPAPTLPRCTRPPVVEFQLYRFRIVPGAHPAPAGWAGVSAPHYHFPLTITIVTYYHHLVKRYFGVISACFRPF